MPKTTTIAFRVTQRIHQRLGYEAKQKGVSVSDLARDKVAGKPDLLPGTQQMTKALAEGLGIPEDVVIENIVIRYLAEKTAMEQIWGTAPAILPEFTSTPSGTLTGEELMDFLAGHFRRQFERERESILEAHETWGNSPEDQAWLDGRRQRRKQPVLEESLKGLPPESREIALEGMEHHEICKEIERTEGEEAALAYHHAYIDRKRQRRNLEANEDADLQDD